jgi:integrase
MTALPLPQSVLEVPASAKTLDGVEWDPRAGMWVLPSPSGDHWFNMEALAGRLASDLLDTYRLAMIRYLETRSVAHCAGIHANLVALLKAGQGPDPVLAHEITPAMVLAFKLTLSSRKEYRLGAIRRFLREWRAVGLPGIPAATASLLGEMRLRGGPKGEAVLTADPEAGPFSDIEFQGIIGALNDGFAKGAIPMEDYVLVWLYLAFGVRSVQLAALKAMDFRVVEAPSGAKAFLLDVPRAKQRGVSPRGQFKTRKVIPEVGELLEEHVKRLRMMWVDLDVPAADLPMFVNPFNYGATEGLLFHATSRDLKARLDQVFEGLAITSERTGKILKITSRRFRYTRGTRAAAEGANELVIAEILDHSDTQNVGVYVKAVPEIIERIDKAMALHLAPMAQAFVGQLIEGEWQARRAGDPRSKIVSPEAAKPVGNCGGFGFCGALAPIACYTCRHFQPWLNGPHEAVLEVLIRERERILADTGDTIIAAINDRTILACAEVVRLCQVAGSAPDGPVA